MSAYRLTGEAKVRGCIDFIDNLLESGCKFLLFAHHLSVLDSFQKYLISKQATSKFCCQHIRIDGRTKVEDRHKLVNQFQNCDSIRVALLSISACSVGMTLTAASTVVFSELIWTPSMMQQAEDRVHRIGQSD